MPTKFTPVTLGLLVLISSSPWQPAFAQERQGGKDQSPEPVVDSPRLLALQRNLQAGKRDAAEQFWSEVKGKAPLVEPVAGKAQDCWVTYLWRGDASTQRVDLIGGVPQGAPKQLSRLPDTDLWYRTEWTPRDARFAYGFVVNPGSGLPSKVSRDPLGARTYADESVVELPGAPPQPWSEKVKDVPEGKLEACKVKSAVLKADRGVTVYTPAGYDSKGEAYDLVVVFDGEACGGDLVGFNPIPIPTILDNLVAQKRIAPMVAVFVDSGETRDRDLGCHAPFVEFLAKELIPWVRSRYRVSADAQHTVVSGFSRGGLCAAYCGLLCPETFGNVLVQSGAFWWYLEADLDAGAPRNKRARLSLDREPGWLTRQFVARPRVAVRFYIEAGKFEVAQGGGILVESHRTASSTGPRRGDRGTG
jgi:enterochelin esterase-like enzyme